jgi:glycosyltransferase involved in cell wall biosynthesis
MLNIHRTLGTYRRHVDLYLAVSEFMRDQYLAGGFRPEQVVYKPNFVQDPGIGAGDGGYALFVGRLTEEKGLPTLLEAWRTLNGSIKLKIVGDGPLREKVQAAAATSYGIEYLGRQPSAEVHRLMQAAAMLVFPSTWFEGQPLTIIESLACGTPVLASDLGAMATMITPGRTGSLFTPGDPAALAKEASRLFADRSQLQPMRPAARADYERHYTPAAVYRRLMDCYENALQRRRSAAAPVAFPAAN